MVWATSSEFRAGRSPWIAAGRSRLYAIAFRYFHTISESFARELAVSTFQGVSRVKSIFTLGIAAVVFFVAALTNSAQDKKTDKKPVPKKTVATDPKDGGIDFEVQGEYEGDKRAAQVFALGDGK